MNGVPMSRALTASVKRVASRYIEKRAGLLQPPPKMVDAITAWAEANTAATRLESREGGDTLSESELREIARRGKGEAVPYNGEIAKKFLTICKKQGMKSHYLLLTQQHTTQIISTLKIKLKFGE